MNLFFKLKRVVKHLCVKWMQQNCIFSYFCLSAKKTAEYLLKQFNKRYQIKALYVLEKQCQNYLGMKFSDVN